MWPMRHSTGKFQQNMRICLKWISKTKFHMKCILILINILFFCISLNFWYVDKPLSILQIENKIIIIIITRFCRRWLNSLKTKDKIKPKETVVVRLNTCRTHAALTLTLSTLRFPNHKEVLCLWIKFASRHILIVNKWLHFNSNCF